MTQHGHIMTNTETNSTIYFIDMLVDAKKYSIDIMNTASKLGPHTQTDRGTCPGVGL